MRRMISSLILIIFLVVIMLTPLGSIRVMAAQTVDGSIANATDWLKSNQNPDGSWGIDDNAKFRTTSKVVEKLATYGLLSQSSQSGTSWLKSNPPLNNTDLVRYIAIPELTSQEWIAQLKNAQAEYGGWGTKSKGPSDNITTCLAAMLFLKDGIYPEEVTKAAYHLLSNQNTDGSWGMVKGENTGSVEITGMIRAFLIRYQSQIRCNMSAELGKASQWLISSKYPDGGWGTIEATYMAFMGLQEDKPSLVNTVPDYLINKQEQNGSWNNNPYQTALALDVLSAERLEAPVSIKDIKLFANGVEADSFSPRGSLEIVPIYSGRNVNAYVTVITTEGLRINLAQNSIGGFSWDCAMNKEGTYVAEIVLKDSLGQVRDILTKSFGIEPILEISECEIDITPGACLVNKPVKPLLNFYVNCNAANVTKPVNVTCSVTSPGGVEIYSTQGSCILKTGENSIPLGSFSPILTSPGEYIVKATLSYEGEEIFRRSDSFHILEQISSTYTSDADFDMGTLKGLNHEEVENQLQLNKNAEVFPYIWIANAGENTVSKMDTRTGKEVGRYSTGSNSSPSRTAVDKDGNCWVGNRNIGTVVKIAMTGGIDKNGNGKIDTSADLNQNGKIDAKEILPWGQDEAILISTSVGYNSSCIPRALAIDKKGRIWVGLYQEKRFVVLNPDNGSFTGISVSTQSTPYGAVIDKDGHLWSSGRGTINRIEKVDTNTDTFVDSYDIGTDPYGIVVDKQGIVWVPSYGSSALIRFNPITKQYTKHFGNGVNGRGVGVDRDGNIWVAYSGNNWVDKFDANGNYLLSTNIGAYGGAGPIGVGVDSNGYIWVTCNSSNNTFKIDTSGKIIGTYAVGAGPYTYSDMTGFNLQNVTAHDGTWTVTYDGGKEECTWANVSWSSEEPENTTIGVKVKAANQIENLVDKSFTNISNGAPIVNVSGRFLMIEAKLNTSNSQSPVLNEIRIEGKDGILKADAGPDINVQAEQSCLTAEVFLDGSASIDPDGNKLSYKWSWNNGNETAEGVQPTIMLPIGNTEVKLVVNNGFRDSEPDTVMVTVSEISIPLEKPQTPENFQAQLIEGTQVYLSWSPAQYASYYEVEVDGVIINNKDNVTYLHTGLAPESTHSYKVRAANSKGTSEWTELLSITITNYADEVDRILKQVEAMLPVLKDSEIIKKAQDLLESAIDLMPKVREGAAKDSLLLRINNAQDAIMVAQIDVELVVIENILPNISSLEPIKKSLEQVQLEVNNLPLRLDNQKTVFQLRIDAIYKHFSNNWYLKPSMESPKSKAAVINVTGKIYAIGGIPSAGGVSDSIEEFSPITNKWVTKTSMPNGPRQGMVAASADGKIYVIGGKTGSQNLRIVEEYDPLTDMWKRKADMPTARQGAVAAAVNGKIYVIGGYNGVKHFKTVEEYDPATNQWTSVSRSPMLTARDTCGVAVVDNKIYVIGGFNSQNKYLSTVEVYDPTLDKWEAKAHMNTERRALGVCQINNLIFAIGGYNSEGDLGKVEVYNPLADEWQERMEMSMKRSYLSTVAINSSVYAIGGTFGGNPVNTVEEFIP